MALACAAAAGNAAAQPWDSDSGVPSVEWRGRLELKRINTSRGTPEETTRTALRVETFLDGAVSLLRVDLPFPDADTDFDGSPFDPRLGDIKVQDRLARARVGRACVSVLRRAHRAERQPSSLGSGKYQLGAGIRMLAPFKAPLSAAGARHAVRGRGFADDFVPGRRRSRADVNYTKLELTLLRFLARAVHA